MKNDEKLKAKPTVGSLFAGVGGIDLGFEQAGWRTAWMVERDGLKKAVLGDRFPDARLFEDVRDVGEKNLSQVDCLVGGFPCQDISNAGAGRKAGRLGLGGERSGLFWEVVRIIREIQPTWLVLENVPALLHSNDCKDFEVVIKALADCGYVGLFRVLNAQYFGIPQKRNRIFLVAGLNRFPPLELLSDAAPVEALSCSFRAIYQPWCKADDWAGHTLSAMDTPTRIGLGSEVLVAESDRWGAMVERERISRVDGVSAGLGKIDLSEKRFAGDAVCPPVARWIAEKLIKEHNS
jgi:DNA (cytosine-5)-methyltransferase 1